MHLPSSSSTKRILIVDDEYSIRQSFALALQTPELIVESVASPSLALKLLQTETFSAMILDFQMPEMDGLAMARIQAERGIICPTILASAMATTDHVVAAARVGIVDHLSKPVNIQQLRTAVAHLLWRQATFGSIDSEKISGLSADQQYEAAKYYLQRRNFSQANKILLKNHPDPQSEVLLALIAEAEKRFDVAEKFYRRALFPSSVP